MLRPLIRQATFEAQISAFALRNEMFLHFSVAFMAMVYIKQFYGKNLGKINATGVAEVACKKLYVLGNASSIQFTELRVTEKDRKHEMKFVEDVSTEII